MKQELKDFVSIVFLLTFVFTLCFIVARVLARAEAAEYKEGLYVTSILQD